MMPQYFFDVDDGERFTRDDLGLDCPDHAAVREQAIGLLPELARDRLPDGDEAVFSVKVRDGGGRCIFRAALALTAEWLNGGGDGQDR